MTLDVHYVREQFPSLEQTVNGYPAAFFDGPGGTQVPKAVIEAMEGYLTSSNANKGGAFQTSQRTDEIIRSARKALADFLGCDAGEVAFGENTTSLIYRLAHGIGRNLKEGEEVIITELDHEANRQPWLDLEDRGVKVREVEVDVENLRLNMEDLKEKLSQNTAVVACSYASNAVGTITPLKEIITAARKVGAITVVDAVHYALHGPIDVKSLGCDFLLCSVYKFFGPHLGVLYGKRKTFEGVQPYRLRPQPETVPFRIERGTKNHEGIAGARATVDFLARLGEKFGSPSSCITNTTNERRRKVVAAMQTLDKYETPLATGLTEQLSSTRGVEVYRPSPNSPSTSTVSFVVNQLSSREVAKQLAKKGIFVWDGDFYATTLIEKLELAEKGGLVRVGLAPYNTEEEIERLIGAVKELV